MPCDKYDNSLSKKNKTNRNIFYCIQALDSLVLTENNRFNNPLYLIKKGSSKLVIVLKDTHKNLFYKSKNKNSYVFVFELDTFLKYDKLQIVNK